MVRSSDSLGENINRSWQPRGASPRPTVRPNSSSIARNRLLTSVRRLTQPTHRANVSIMHRPQNRPRIVEVVLHPMTMRFHAVGRKNLYGGPSRLQAAPPRLRTRACLHAHAHRWVQTIRKVFKRLARRHAPMS